MPAEDRGWSAEDPYPGVASWDDDDGDDPWDPVGPDPEPAPLVLAATDPAQPYGAALPWPESAGRPARAAGAHVVLVDGRPLAHLERGGRSVSLFPGAAGRGEDAPPLPPTDDDPAGLGDGRWADGLASLVRNGRRRSLEVTKVDGQPVRESPAADLLRAAGFSDSYRGLVLRSR